MRVEDLTKENLRCTTDAVFKVLLSYQQELIFHIIQDCTENTPTKINLKNPIMPPIKDDKKTCIYDLLVEDNNEIYYNIEMQNGRITEKTYR